VKRFGMTIPENRRFACTCLGAVNNKQIPLSLPGFPFTPWAGAMGAVYNPSGAELNVLDTMGSVYDLRTRFVTGLPRGHALLSMIKRRVRGMNAHFDARLFDMNPHGCPGISNTYTNFPFSGFTDKVTYDRHDEAAQHLKFEHHDWGRIMEETQLFHTGGLFSFLNRELVLYAAGKANEHGVPMSFDPNWRKDLVRFRCETDGCTEDDVRASLCEIVSKASIMFANVSDPVNALGITKPDKQRVNAFFDGEKGGGAVFEEMIEEIAGKFPNLKIIALQLRRERSVDDHDWSAVAYETEKKRFAWAPRIALIRVLSRAGGGDGFAGAVESGVLLGKTLDECVAEGWASGALVAKCPTDTTLATMEDIQAFLQGVGDEIQR